MTRALVYVCLLFTVFILLVLWRVYRVTKYGTVLMADSNGFIEGSGY